MQPIYFNQVKEFLLKLKNNQGHFIIQDGYFDSVRNSGNEVFCQFAKDNGISPITFEAVSHHFNVSLAPKSSNLFFDLGFTLEDKSNYTKNIYLNSDIDIHNTALEVVKVFEEFYQVDEHSIYDFDDEIEIVSNTSTETQNKTYTNTTNQNKKWNKISNAGWVLIIIVIIGCYYAFIKKDEKKTPQYEISNSQWDASVYQVETYLRNNLNDPDSYQSISWSAIVKLNDTEQIGFTSYQVRHKYRAKNSFGGYVVEEKLFRLDYKGNVVNVSDFAR